MSNPFGESGTAQCVLLTTFRKDGTPVSTPLWAALDGDRLVMWTVTDSWKVKRIRRNPAVTLQPCSYSGKPHGEQIDAKAVVLGPDETDHVRSVIIKKYGIMGFLTVKGSLLRRGKSGTVGLALHR